jgi:ABC-type multidrug transport system ATPase subunit/pSer/pThr/pTyr-binding forkhead associated (FHA) protein/ABC-type multidrug transport system permease subunit
MSVVVKVHFFEGDHLVNKIAFQRGSHIAVTIGKKGQNVEVELSAEQVSRQHAQLIFTSEAELFVVDLGSTNGTFFNSKRVDRNDKIKLVIGDVVYLTKDQKCYFKIVHPDEKASVISSSKPQSKNLEQTDIINKFKSTNIIYIGREDDCDVRLNSLSISRKHCSIERLTDGTFKLKDLDSLNGTFVNGRRVKGSVKITDKDQIIIGRFVLSLSGKAKDLSTETAIRLAGITKQYPNGYIGLHETTISIPSKSLLAIMGPSGCGKSTLLKALNGESPPSHGNVFLFEQELVANYEYLKTQIGYVPQDDIVHRELTVEQSLYFAAKLRLDRPTKELIEPKIEQVLKDLNIAHIRKNLVSKISGGQRKRVSIAVELLTDPLILFLDEPTSPLDPQTIEEFLGILKKLAERGTTVVMVTHKPEDLAYMDQVIFMAEGGHMVYYGDTDDYQKYFGVENPVKVYMNITGADKQKWIEKFNKANPVKSGSAATTDIRQSSNANPFVQWVWLTARYLAIKTNDKTNTTILLAQAPIIAALICIIFNEISIAVPFLIAISAIWFGVNNAAREIVSELPIYTRERMFNVRLLPYLMSKITVLTIFSAIQALLFISIIGITYSGDEIPFENPFGAFVWMMSLSIAATLMGLLLSAVVNSTEKVMTLVPIALIPQILLGGFVAKISNGFVEVLSYATLSRWGTEGFADLQNTVIAPVVEPVQNPMGELTLKMVERPNDATKILLEQFHRTYQENFSEMAGTIELDFVAVGAWSLIFFLGTIWALKRKDSI